jgi:geranylgeranylglycerol-phosphate geranylgeranyltransferase
VKIIKPAKGTLLKKPFEFLSHWRSLPPYELLSYICMYASVPMLAYGINTYDYSIIRLIVLTIITLYAGFFAALIWNDITDVDIDELSHPDRPLPSGRISKQKFFGIALIFSAITFIFAYLLSIWCLFLVGVTALFTTFHNKYLKHRIKIPAYSEIFTPVQWLTVAIFGYLALWTVHPLGDTLRYEIFFFGPISFTMYDVQNMMLLVLFTYFAVNAHDLPEGIYDFEGDKKKGVRTYATSFGPKNAAKISFLMFIISGIFALLLFYRTILSPFFLITFLIIWFYVLYHSYNLVKSGEESRKHYAKIAGRKGYDYFLMAYNLIFLDIFLQLILHHSSFSI